MSPKILYVAPLLDFSGYAHAARDYVKALDHVGCNIVTRHVKYDNGQYTPSDKEKELSKKNLQNVDIVIQHTTPNETFYKPGVFNVIYFAWETDRLPKEWVDKINLMDLALVPCEENIRAARKSGVIIPMCKIVHTFDLNKYNVDLKPYSVRGAEHLFKFLSICQLSRKKGVDPLLKAYLSEFDAGENVILLLKTYIAATNQNNHQEKAEVLRLIDKVKEILRLKEYPKIHVIPQVLSDLEISRLYKTAHCYCLPSRGEGFSITHFDAMGFGLPPIALDWGGPTEFITDKEGWLVKSSLSPVVDMKHPFPYLYTGKENWAEPDVSSLRKAMREAFHAWDIDRHSFNSRTTWSRKIKSCKKRVKNFTYDIVGKNMKDAIIKHYNMWKEVNVC